MNNLISIFVLLCCLLGFVAPSQAETAIWHCSRNTPPATITSQNDHVDPGQNGDFYLAAFNADVDVISISIADLIDIYGGKRVTLGKMELSACFIPGQNELSTLALKSLGINGATAQILSKKNSLIQTNLYLVTNEQQMEHCIATHFPAVGYFNKPRENEEVAPCF